MTKSLKKARKMLIEACSGYLQHNQSELDKLMPTSGWYKASEYFSDVLGKWEPDPGFLDWIKCQYHNLLTSILNIFEGRANYFSEYDCKEYPFPKVKWWNSRFENCDHTDPSVVLHNLQAFFYLLDHYMKEMIGDLDEKKSVYGYQENNLVRLSEAPPSTQMTKTLENLRLRASFLEKVMEQDNLIDICRHATNEYSLGRLKHLCQSLDILSPDFDCYIKGIAVKELKSILENSDVTDQEAIKRVEEQLSAKGGTLELLQKNRQSELEKGLKLMSVITILIGVGIFPTLFLAGKRLYDSGGTSINFFKPLSLNLCETIGSITEDIEDLNYRV